MALRLTFLCAAPTAALHSGAFPQDEPIDPKGAAKAAAVKDDLRWSGRSVSSPARRALQTAEALGLTPAIDPALRDCDYGRWSGRPLAAIHAEDPDGISAWMTDPAAAPHGGESIADLIRRVAAWLDAIDSDSSHTVVITHPAVIRAAIIHTLNAPPHSFWHIDVEPLSKTDLRRNNGRWALRASGCDRT